MPPEHSQTMRNPPPQPMVTCKNDTISFTFPEVDAALARCAKKYNADTLPKVLAEDRRRVLDRLLRPKAGWVARFGKQGVLGIVGSVTPDQVAVRFKDMVRGQVNFASARLEIAFHRTLRVPDDGRDYPLPPGLGMFPLRRMEAYADGIPPEWRQLGGALMPMYQAEAVWVAFDSHYAFALKIGTGTVNAVNGQPFSPGLQSVPQGYVVVPEQPWLDGYCVGEGVVRQFVAARLGAGHTAEEQIQGTTQGSIQLEAIPCVPETFFAAELNLMALKGSLTLARLESLFTLAEIARDLPYAREGRVTPGPVISLGAVPRAKVTE